MSGPKYASLGIALALLIATARVGWVLYGMPELPVFDQWSAIDGIGVPVSAGAFDWRYIFLPHNEHLLVWTKLIDWTQLAISDNQIDARPAGLLLALLSGVAMAFVLAGAVRFVPIGKVPFLIAALALAAVPYAWENLTEGWGNSYLFLIAGALATLQLAARARSTAMLLLLVPAVLLSVLAMGSGVIAPLLGIVIVAVRARRGDLSIVRSIVSIVVLTAGIALAAALTVGHAQPQAAAHGSFLLRAAQAVLLSIVFVPTAAFAREVARRTAPDAAAMRDWRIDAFVAAFAAWGYLQVLAIIAFRPEFHLWFPISRYMDVLTAALLANIACALRLGTQAWATRRAIIQASVRVFAAVTVLAAPLPIALYRWQVDRWTQTQALVQHVVRTGDLAALDRAPIIVLPFPGRDYFKSRLADGRVRRVLGDIAGTRPQPAPFVAASRCVEAWLEANAAWLAATMLLAGLALLVAAWRRVSAAAPASVQVIGR